MRMTHTVLHGDKMLPARVQVPQRRAWSRPSDTHRLPCHRLGATRSSHAYVLAVDLFHPDLSMEMGKWAIENVVHSDDRVILCNVVVVPPVSVFTQPDGTLVTAADVLEALTKNDEIESQMEERMKEFELTLSKNVGTGRRFETRVVADPDILTAMVTSDKRAVTDILDMQVREIGADSCTLLLAATCHGGLAELLTGSIAAGSVRRSAADAVIVYRTAKKRNLVGSENRKIVVPVDESELSQQALTWIATHIARKGDLVKLLHVVPSVPWLLPTPTLGLSPAALLLGTEVEERNLTQATEYITTHLVPILEEHHIDYEIDSTVQITDGSTENLGKKLLDHARDAHLIVIGSASHGGINEFVFGSLANYLDHHASIPVIVVHGAHDRFTPHTSL